MPFAVTDGELRALSVLTGPTNPISRPFGVSTFSYHQSIRSYENIYKSQPAVRTVIDFQARKGGGLPIGLFTREDETTKVRRRDHPLDVLLQRPHPRWSRAKFMRALLSDLLTFDNSVVVKVRLPDSVAPRALTRLPPQRVLPLGGDWMTADAFQIMGTDKVFPWDDVVHLNSYNPEDVRWGLSPIETLRRILAEDLASSEARDQYLERAARLAGWVSRPTEAPEWSDTARDRFNESWRDRLTGEGPEAGSTPVLEEGMTFHQETFDAEATAYLEARKLTGVEVSRTFHQHPALLGFSDAPPDDATRRALVTDALTPLMEYVAGELLIQLLPDFELPANLADFELDFDIEALQRGDFLVEAEATSRAVGGPWLLRNEARARRNLPPLEGGDDLITPLNVTTGGRASPADTAPGTPGLGQAARAYKAPDTAVLTKALTPTARTWAEKHAAIVSTNAARQHDRFRTRLGVGHDVTSAFNKTRADNELGDDLSGLALEYAPVAAASVADRFGIDYDLTAGTAWLINNARKAAENFNATTLAAILAAETDADVDTSDVAGDAFDEAGGSRADGFGIGRVVSIAGFATHDAATQGGASSKTWQVNSSNPRASHAALDGTTIPIEEDFEVGASSAPWPGSPELDADEVAGCTCSVEFA